MAAVQQRYGITKPYIYYLGNFQPHKNDQSLIKAYARLEPELRARFVLALGGREDRWCPERKALEAQLTERGRR